MSLNSLSQLAFSQRSYRPSGAQQPTVPHPHALLDEEGPAQTPGAVASMYAGDSNMLP
jgi:hypothetical protein